MGPETSIGGQECCRGTSRNPAGAFAVIARRQSVGFGLRHGKERAISGRARVRGYGCGLVGGSTRYSGSSRARQGITCPPRSEGTRRETARSARHAFATGKFGGLRTTDQLLPIDSLYAIPTKIPISAD